MRVFLDELQKRHRARLGALIARHKAGVGYVILCIGVIVAITFAFEALNKANERDEITRAVICQNTVVNDRQQLTNLVTKSGHELIKSFHLTLPQAAKLIHKQLETSAEERKTLQPSKPASACTAKLTTLDLKSLKPPASKETRALLKIASAPVAVHRISSTPKPTPKRSTSTPAPVPPPPSAPAQPKAVTPSKPQAPSPVVKVTPPSTTTPPVVKVPTPTPPPVLEPAPPTVKIPPVTVGPVTTPEVTITK